MLAYGSVRRPEAQLWLSTSNSARNSPSTSSNIEFMALELQRFRSVAKSDHDKLRATFGWRSSCCCPWATQPGPRVSSGALHTCGAGLLMCGSARRLVVRPGPAAARMRRSLALSAGWPGCRKPSSPLWAREVGQLQPSSPLLAGTRVGLKPSSPLRVRIGCFWCVFRAQRWCRFHRSLVVGVQWCCWFQRRHVVAPRAR